MAFNFEDDLVPEEKCRVLDMSDLKITNTEELQQALLKIPRLKLRKEEPQQHGDYDGSEYDFADPTPDGMENVRVRDVSQVDIDWKMLTLDRPRVRGEEELFSRLVEMDKLQMRSSSEDVQISVLTMSNKPIPVMPTMQSTKRRSKGRSRRGRLKQDADDESDDSDHFVYDSFSRHAVKEDPDAGDLADLADEQRDAPDEEGAESAVKVKTSRKKKSSGGRAKAAASPPPGSLSVEQKQSVESVTPANPIIKVERAHKTTSSKKSSVVTPPQTAGQKQPTKTKQSKKKKTKNSKVSTQTR